MKFTANILAIYLLLGSFIPRSDFSQLLLLKDLQEHYQLHCQEAATEGREVCLQEFLYDHFIEHNNHDHADNGCSHDGLPMHSSSSSFLMAFVQMDFEKKLVDTFFYSAAPIFQNIFYSYLNLSGIDRPPC